jgi:ribonuclease HI
LAYTVNDPQNPNNYLVYVVDQDLGICILSIGDDFEVCIENTNTKIEVPKENVNIRNGMWKMFFDNASSWEGAGDGVLLVAPNDEYYIPFSYRLQFGIGYTNNVCEYKALILGLEAARKLKIKHLTIYGDVELIVKQIIQLYQAKHPRMRSYRNCAWDLIENFFLSFNIHDFPRLHNQQVDSLAKAATTFIPPTIMKLKYHIDMRHKPSIPNNVHYWKKFQDDEQIKQFLEMVDDSCETHIDQENQNDPVCIMQEGENL